MKIRHLAALMLITLLLVALALSAFSSSLKWEAAFTLIALVFWACLEGLIANFPRRRN